MASCSWVMWRSARRYCRLVRKLMMGPLVGWSESPNGAIQLNAAPELDIQRLAFFLPATYTLRLPHGENHQLGASFYATCRHPAVANRR